MITGRIFYFFGILLIMLAAFIFLSPSLINPDIIYPERIDSAYFAFHSDNNPAIGDSLLFSPADVGLEYKNISIKTKDGLTLKGWFIDSGDSTANTITIIHDVTESKLLYLDHIRQFHDRGFDVCIFDMRAHGTSEGLFFAPGIPETEDISIITDTILKIKKTKHIILMGVGTGAALALEASVADPVYDALILQSPFNNFKNYLSRYSSKKWGGMKPLWYPVLKRKIERLLHFPIGELDLTLLASHCTIPSMIITGSDDELSFTSEAVLVFDASAAEKKELILVRNEVRENMAKAGGESYYNKITGFIISVIPKPVKTSRYKKLALNDH